MRAPEVDAGAGMRAAPAPLSVTWLGHATTVIELDAVRLITDPVLGARVGPLRRIAPPVGRDAAEGHDVVLLSHLHADHADARSLRAIGPDTEVLAPAGSRRWLQARGLRNVRELGVGEWASVGAVSVGAVPARHGTGRWRRTGAGGARALGFLICGSQTCYFAGDTDIFAGMGRLAGCLDLALLPVGGWGPTLGPGHMDPDRAARAVALMKPRVAVPIHWGTFAPGWPSRMRPDLTGPGPDFAALVAQRAPAVDARVLQPGGRLEVAAATSPPRDGQAAR